MTGEALVRYDTDGRLFAPECIPRDVMILVLPYSDAAETGSCGALCVHVSRGRQTEAIKISYLYQGAATETVRGTKLMEGYRRIGRLEEAPRPPLTI